jgi:hypothetical protein
MKGPTVLPSSPDLLFFAGWCVGVLLGAMALLAVWQALIKRHRAR